MEEMEPVHSNANISEYPFLEPESMRTECNGEILLRTFGSWKGHVLPGVLMILWGSWWAYNICMRYLASRRGNPYRSSAWYPFANKWVKYVEPALKVILPPIAVSIELYWDHPDGYRYLFCPEGSKYAGRFAVTHMNNWQHTSSYPAFVMSGLVDFMGMFMHVPAGLSQAFLSLAFSAEAFLMAVHKKHTSLDEMVHWLLYVTMLLCAMFIVLEMRYSKNVLLGAGKAASVVFQGAWLLKIAEIMMEGHPQWSMAYMGSTMMAPVYFVMVGVFVCFCFLALYVVLHVLVEKGLLWEPAYTPLEEQQDTLSPSFNDDSAQHSSEDSPLVVKGNQHVTPFQISHGHEV